MSINVNELRIGNKVLRCSDSFEPYKWRETTVNLTYLKLIYEFPENYSPIILSPEILEKCGFKKYDWQDAMFIKTDFGDLYIHFYKGRIITRMVKVSSDSNGQKMVSLPFIGNVKSVENIIHLHTLQNFIYSITGEELTYTP